MKKKSFPVPNFILQVSEFFCDASIGGRMETVNREQFRYRVRFLKVSFSFTYEKSLKMVLKKLKTKTKLRKKVV